MSLERERKLIEQFQEGLQTINEIVQGTKEQSVISLSHSQTVLNDSMKSLADTVEEVKNQIFSKHSVLEDEIGEFQGKISNIEASTYKHATSVNELLEKEVTRIEKIVGAFETHLESRHSELSESMTSLEEK